MNKYKSDDYKLSAVKYYLIGDETQINVCKIFKCSVRSLMRWYYRYKKFIFSPARWCISLSLIGATPKDNILVIIEKITAWSNCWKLPRFIAMTYADNRILLDRNIWIRFRLQGIIFRRQTESIKTHRM